MSIRLGLVLEDMSIIAIILVTVPICLPVLNS